LSLWLHIACLRATSLLLINNLLICLLHCWLCGLNFLLIYLLYHLLISLSCSLSLLLSSCRNLLLNLSLINWHRGSLLLWLTLCCALWSLFNGLLRLSGRLFDHCYLIIVLLNFTLINLSLLNHLLLTLSSLNLHTSSWHSLILLSLYILLRNLFRSWRLHLLISCLNLCVCLWLIFTLCNDFIASWNF